MGCDIHMYIEYANKKRLEETRKKKAEGDTEAREYWRSFGGRMNPGRDYWMFGILSQGVRSDNPNGFPPKGRLDRDELSWGTAEDDYLYIVDEGREPGDNETTLERALKWASGRFPETLVYRDGKPRFVSHPDWHSHSWLTPAEYKKALELYQADCDKQGYGYKVPSEYKAILAALESLESNGENEARVVFWFDN